MATLDSLQDSVNSLTSSTTTLVSEVQVKKAILDASVADAGAAETAAVAARDTTLGYKNSAETAATSATNTATSLTGFNLGAIDDSTSSLTANDVFVYDTSLDSDSGAWRHRTQATSWYNETLNTATRGNRKEFPAVAVIVVEAAKVTILDGDDPAMPMWMVFSNSSGNPIGGSGLTSTSAKNGKIAWGDSNLGITYSDFIADTIYRHRSANASYNGLWLGGVSTRNEAVSNIGWEGTAVSSSKYIVNNAVNDVTMTVLPNAPVDAATGLQVPTIAVATAGGVSVIKDDGNVYDSDDVGTILKVRINDLGELYWARTGTSAPLRFSGNIEDITADGFVNKSFSTSSGPGLVGRTERLATISKTSKSLANLAAGSDTTGGDAGVTFIKQTGPTNNEGLSAYSTVTYATGWMPRFIKTATLASNDATDAVGSGELVTNGVAWTGATGNTPPTGWTKANDEAIYTIVGGALQIDRNSGGSEKTEQTFATTLNQFYTISFDVVSVAVGNVVLETSGSGTNSNYSASGTGTKSVTFRAVSSTTTVGIRPSSTTGVIQIDNVSCLLAEDDRCYNRNGLQVFGTITKTAVATGADTMGYSGWSASNYLQQPINADLDFGTGDFSIMGWATASASSDWMLDRKTPGSISTAGFELYQSDGGTTSGNLRFKTHDGTAATTTDLGTVTDRFTHFAAVRNGGVTYGYVNGVLTNSGADTRNVTNTSATLFVGVQADVTSPYTNGSLALLRISATAPSPEQIAKIYNDEKYLFQENAQSSLYGTQGYVRAMAYDESTDLLYVGTNEAKQVYSGLRRVSYTTPAVNDGLSAVNGLVVEE